MSKKPWKRRYRLARVYHTHTQFCDSSVYKNVKSVLAAAVALRLGGEVTSGFKLCIYRTDTDGKWRLYKELS